MFPPKTTALLVIATQDDRELINILTPDAEIKTAEDLVSELSRIRLRAAGFTLDAPVSFEITILHDLQEMWYARQLRELIGTFSSQDIPGGEFVTMKPAETSTHLSVLMDALELYGASGSGVAQITKLPVGDPLTSW